MATYLSPIGNETQLDANGDPLAGGMIYTYLAGTTTPTTTYTDSTGVTPQSNPIVLNSHGLPSSPIWLGAGVAIKMVFTDTNGVTARNPVDNILGVNDPSAATAQDQWVNFAGTPTYISATSFSVVGDQTPTFQVLRRVKSSNSGGTVYSSISASSFATGVTTITVTNDSGTLDSGLSSVSYGLLSATNPSIPELSIGKALRTASSVAAALAVIPIQSGTLTSASGGAVDFTGIPSWAKRVTVQILGVSTNGTNNLLLQLGDAGGLETGGYSGSTAQLANAAAVGVANHTAGGANITVSTSAASVISGSIELTLANPSNNTWAIRGQAGFSDTTAHVSIAGAKSTSAALDRVRITTTTGVDTFDAGSFNILFE